MPRHHVEVRSIRWIALPAPPLLSPIALRSASVHDEIATGAGPGPEHVLSEMRFPLLPAFRNRPPADDAPLHERRAYAQRRERAGALGLTIVIHILVFAILLFSRSMPMPEKMQSTLKGFMVMSETEEKGEETKQAEAKAETKQSAESESRPVTQPEEAPPPPKPDLSVPSENKSNFILLSSEDFASSNIGSKPSQRQGAQAAAQSGPAVQGPGAGPNGAQVYSADWYRRPTNVELSTYIPPNAPRSGWGMVACRTVERYHVEDCYILGESPRGSGLGRAVLNAAWQFLVLPPRVNGRAQTGTWVSIRIDYTEKGGFQPSY